MKISPCPDGSILVGPGRSGAALRARLTASQPQPHSSIAGAEEVFGGNAQGEGTPKICSGGVAGERQGAYRERPECSGPLGQAGGGPGQGAGHRAREPGAILIAGHVVLILELVPTLDLLVLVLQTLVPVFQAFSLGRDPQLAASDVIVGLADVIVPD